MKLFACIYPKLCLSIVVIFIICSSHHTLAKTHPDMLPEYATSGKYPTGVKTYTLSNPKYIDPLTQKTGRSLGLEIWYPALQKTGSVTTYDNVLRSGKAFSMPANSLRDAAFDGTNKWPLIVLSHGYTGYRTIMFYLAEHLAAHGYVVVGIDHTDSTNAEIDMLTAPFAGFISTLLNRSRDQQMTLNYLKELEHTQAIFGDETNWIARQAGLIGYSMGGYGALNTVGGCFDFPATLISQLINSDEIKSISNMKKLLDTCSAGQSYTDQIVDAQWQAMVALAPWGGQHQLFASNALAKITVPTLFISGDHDDISGYSGITDIYDKMESPNTFFLTLLNARHNIAPHTAPDNAWDNELDFGHYYEPAWSGEQLHAINKHFSLVMMQCYLRGVSEACDMLKLSQESHQRLPDGTLGKPWQGFDHRYSTGMEWRNKADKVKKN